MKKEKMFLIHMTKEDFDRLQILSAKEKKSKAEIIRQLITKATNEKQPSN